MSASPLATPDRAPRWQERDPPQPRVREVIPPSGDLDELGDLSGTAFTLSSDPRLVFHSAAYDSAAQELLGAIHRREGAVVLTGEPGVGKTTLCRALVEQVDRRTLTSLVFDRTVSVEDLLTTVLIDLGIMSPQAVGERLLTRADLDAAFHDFLTSLVPLQAFAVLILDEAQTLPADVFDWLNTLADRGDRERLLQVVLVGQPVLLAMLERAAVRPLARRVTVRTTLGPLRRDEMAPYVAHRQSTVSSVPAFTFDERALSRIYELSRGVPAVVNVLCQRTLTEGRRGSSNVIDERLVRTTAARLDLELPSVGSSWLRVLTTIVVLLVFLLAGAAAAALLFRDEVAALVGR